MYAIIGSSNCSTGGGGAVAGDARVGELLYCAGSGLYSQAFPHPGNLALETRLSGTGSSATALCPRWPWLSVPNSHF